VGPLDLPPDLRSRLRRLSLAPRRASAAGFGAHAGRARGGGGDFAQYRAYQQGDDLRRIDWRLYARSDHFFIREAERESPAGLWLLLDASASMGQADRQRPGWTRLDAAKRLAAALIEIALKDGDRFAAAAVTPEGARLTRLGAGARARDQAFALLAPLAAGGIVDWGRDLARLGERIAPASLLIVLSDGFDESCLAGVERLAGAGRDVGFVQILTADERDFPYTDAHRFLDPETGADVLGDGGSLRAGFLARFAQARAAQAARLAACGVRRVEHFLDQEADQAVIDLFQAAARR